MEYLEGLLAREDVARAMAMVEETMGTMVADIIKISQIPAPTFDEGQRGDLIEELYTGLEIETVTRDDVGNVISRLGRADARPNICLVAHMDTSYSGEEDHNASLDGEKLTGPSVADNSVGLAVLVHLARIVKKIPLQLGFNLCCVSTVGSLGKGYSTGIRAIVEEMREDIDVVIGVEGVQLGRIGHFSQGSRFLDIICKVAEGDPWLEAEKPNAVRVMAEIIHKLGSLKLPSEPQTMVNFGFVEGGKDYNKIASSSRCGIEIRSMDAGSLRHLENRIGFWANKISSKMNAQVQIEAVRRYPSGSIPPDHFLVELAREVNTFLNVEPVLGGASPDVSVPLSHGIPSVTLGITEGSAKKGREAIYIKPISVGIKQLLLTILALGFKWEEYTSLPVW